MSEFVITYRVRSHLPIADAAEFMADEQTTGTFIRVPGETDDIRERHRARVLDIVDEELEDDTLLPGSARPDGAPLRQASVRIAFPFDNIGGSIARLMSTVGGNLYELPQLAGLKITDIAFPDEFAIGHVAAPHAVTGTRAAVDRPEGVLVGTIVKPNIGLQPDDYFDLVRTLGFAGIDFIKDDEVNADSPASPLRRRAEAVMRALDEVERVTGRRPLYAFNITDESDRMLENHDYLVGIGARCVMANLNIVGMPTAAALRRHSSLIIHGHMTGGGYIARSSLIGIDNRVLIALARVAGADHVHVGGFRSKFYVSDDETADAVAAVRAPLFDGHPALPVVSSGQWAGTAQVTWDRTGTDDLLVLAGGGMLGHPDGPASGLRSIRSAWQAVAGGVPVEQAAETDADLRRALEFYGSRTR